MYADLQIGLYRREVDCYVVHLTFAPPESEGQRDVIRGGEHAARFNADRLRELALDRDNDGYGRELTESLFRDREVREEFLQACAAAEGQDVAGLRFRLFIDPAAPELHALRWESLRDPRDGSWLLTSERILFSRFLASLDWRRIQPRRRGDLRALVMIADPRAANLDPVDVPGEQARAEASLGEIPRDIIPAGGQATSKTLRARLRDGYDIVYLVCHGTMIAGEGPWLWLEDAFPESPRPGVSGIELVKLVVDLKEPPRLVVLAACQSAGRNDSEDVLHAVGPRLAEAGVPAVLAMQGNIEMDTVASFMPTFFKELNRDGCIDRAVAAARYDVRHQPDGWMPTLFMRVRSGRLWYKSGFAGDGQFEGWPSLLNNVKEKRCTPILGPGVTEFGFGFWRDVAAGWANDFRFPLAPHCRDDLPQVAQFLKLDQDAEFFEKLVQEAMVKLAGGPRTADASAQSQRAALEQLAVAHAHHAAEATADSYRALARLPLPIYLTTNPDDGLVTALRDRSKDPQIALCPWNDHVEEQTRAKPYEGTPTTDQPLVYYLFGRAEELGSLVLTQDDYFDYLIGVTARRDLIPDAVRAALVDHALLFLGFQLDDWSFRVLFRSIVNQEGRALSRRRAHLAVQLTPEEDRLLNPERARRHLESYFREAFEHGRTGIYWGSSEEFLSELLRRYEVEHGHGER